MLNVRFRKPGKLETEVIHAEKIIYFDTSMHFTALDADGKIILVENPQWLEVKQAINIDKDQEEGLNVKR